MENGVLYKISYVVIGGEHPGAIVNAEVKPEPGEELTFDGRVFEIVEIVELMPPVGNFGFLHATCKYLHDA
jgi:hypothetical protein